LSKSVDPDLLGVVQCSRYMLANRLNVLRLLEKPEQTKACSGMHMQAHRLYTGIKCMAGMQKKGPCLTKMIATHSAIRSAGKQQDL